MNLSKLSNFFLNLLVSINFLNVFAVQQIVELNSLSPTYFGFQTSQWDSSSTFSSTINSSCSSKPILGGYGIGGDFQKTFSGLSSHNIIYFQITLYSIDSWTSGSDKITIHFDSTAVSVTGVSSYTKNIFLCGVSGTKDVGRVLLMGKVLHTGSTLTLKFVNGLTGGPTTESYGIRDIFLNFGNKVSGETNELCYYKLDASGSSSNDCGCPMGTIGLLCISSCNAACQGCYGIGADQCYRCAAGYYYDGSQCSACSSTCATCVESSTKCTSCATGKYLMRDGSCVSTCTTPYTALTDSTMYYCLSSCTSSQYLYWNGSCLSTCPSYLNAYTYFGDRYCRYLCTAGQYLLLNGTCANSCTVPFQSYLEGGKNFCTFKCSGSSYYYSNGSCIETCSYPFVAIVKGMERYCDFPCSSGNFLYTNGSCIGNCQGSFVSNVISSVEKYCNFTCIPGLYHYANTSCLPDCPSPFLQNSYGLERYCNFPCPNNKYYLSNGSCFDDCLGTMVSDVKSADESYCYFPCINGEFLYSNGSCLTHCHSPFYNIRYGIENYCYFPCENNTYLYSNSSCLTDCPQPFHPNGISFLTCTHPCNNGYLYPNNSCILTCNPPYQKDDNLHTCSLCLSTDYLYSNESCSATCPFPMMNSSNGVDLYCHYPCPSGQYFFGQNSACYSSCPFPLLNQSGLVPECISPCHQSEDFYFIQNGTCTADCQDPYIANYSSLVHICQEANSINNTNSTNITDSTNNTSTQNSTTLSVIDSATQQKAVVSQALNQVITKTTAVGVVISSAAESGGGLVIAFVILSKFLYCARFIKVNYTKNTMDFFHANNKTIGLGVDWETPSLFGDLSNHENVDRIFQTYGEYAGFFENIWDDIVSISIIMFSIGIITIIQKVSARYKWNARLQFYIQKLEGLVKWNIFLLYFCSSYSNIFISSLIGYQSSSSFSTGIIIAGYILAIMAILLAFYVLYLCCKVAKNVLSIKSKVFPGMISVAEKESLFPVHFLYKDFKEEKFWTLNFLFIQLTREIIFDFVIVLMSNYPLIQTIIIISTGIFMIIFLIISRPYKDNFENFKFVLCEIVLIINFISVLLLALTSDSDENKRDLYGNILINCYLAFTLIIFVFMICSMLIALIQLIKIGIELKKENKFTLKNLAFRYLEIPVFDRIGAFFNSVIVRLRRKKRSLSKKKIGTLILKLQSELASSNSRASTRKGSLVSSKFIPIDRNTLDPLFISELASTIQTPRDEQQGQNLLLESDRKQDNQMNSSRMYFGVDLARLKPLLSVKYKSNADHNSSYSVNVSVDQNEVPNFNLNGIDEFEENLKSSFRGSQSERLSRRDSQKVDDTLNVSGSFGKTESFIRNDLMKASSFIQYKRDDGLFNLEKNFDNITIKNYNGQENEEAKDEKVKLYNL